MKIAGGMLRVMLDGGKMKCNRCLKSAFVCLLILGFLTACETGPQSTKTVSTKTTSTKTAPTKSTPTKTTSTKTMMIGQIQATSSDEEAIYGILVNLIDYINSSQWEKWLSLYSADAVLTTGQKQVDKVEMRRIVDGISYKITEMEILKKNIGAKQASVSVRMVGNGKKHLETYKFKKFSGKWLIVEETNP